MTICQSWISPFGKVWQKYDIVDFFSVRQRDVIVEFKNRIQQGVCPWMAFKNEQENDANRNKIRSAEWYNQAVPSLAARRYFHFFASEERRRKRVEEKAGKSIDSLGFMSLQVSAKCLPRQSSVSTAFCVCFSCFLCESARWKRETWIFVMFLLPSLFVMRKNAKKTGSCPWWWNRGCQGRLQHVLSLRLEVSVRRDSHCFCLFRLWVEKEMRYPFFGMKMRPVIIAVILFVFDWRDWGMEGKIGMVSRSTWLYVRP